MLVRNYMDIIMAKKPISDLRVKILNAISDPTRLEILEYLSKGEKCVCEIIPAFHRSQSAISKHLNILYEAGIVDRRIEGRRTIYRITDPQMLDIIKAVDTLALRQISNLVEAGKSLEESLSN
jgi:ArsR family transcriptional regulator, arsenate/arsenite/antimonite-responsive transcriptional repressor